MRMAWVCKRPLSPVRQLNRHCMPFWAHQNLCRSACQPSHQGCVPITWLPVTEFFERDVSWLWGCVQAPTAIAVFPKEIWTYPKSWCAKQYNLKRWTVMPAGGESTSRTPPGGRMPCALTQCLRAAFPAPACSGGLQKCHSGRSEAPIAAPHLVRQGAVVRVQDTLLPWRSRNS